MSASTTVRGATMDGKKTFNKRANTTGDHGQTYERKLVMYALLQCAIAVKERRISKFRLANNVDAVGAFDDVVLLYEYVDGKGVTKLKTIFVQAKHRLAKSTQAVTIDALLGGTNNDFSLKKYFKSYLDIVGKFRDTEDGKNVLPSDGNCTYVICSNCPLKTACGDFKEVRASEDEPIDLITCHDCTKPNNPQCSHGFHKLAFTKKLKKWIKDKLPDSEGDVRLFFSRLRLHFAQPNEKRLDDLIKHKMRSHWPIPSVELIFSEVYKSIDYWWRHDNFYLTESQDLFEQSHRRLEAKNISRQSRLKEYLKLCSFCEESLAQLKNTLAKKESRAVNVLVRREANVLGVLKTLQTVGDDHFFWDVSDDRSVDDAVLDIFENTVKYLILNINGATRLPAHTLDKLHSILKKENKEKDKESEETKNREDVKKTKNKKRDQKKSEKRDEQKVVVFVMQSDFDDLKKSLREKFQSEYCEIVDEKVNFSDLKGESKSKISNYNVLFQGNTTDVGSISWDDSHTSHVLVSAVEDKPIVIGESLKESNDTYVDRRLEKVVLKKECLDSTLTLAISGWKDGEDFEIRNFFKFEADGDDNSIPLGTNKFLISHYKDFEKVCFLREEIHWLDIKEGNIHWVKSKGAIKDLSRYVSESPSAIDWQEIVENFNKLTIISAEPGMGKSTLFDAMSEKVLRHRQKIVWKIKIDLIYKKKQIEEMKLENVFKFLRNHMEFKTQMEEALFQHYFNEGKVLVMLDGYDEVSAVRRNKVDRMIEIFAEHDSLSVIIATRTHETAHLEDKFNTFAYGLKTFAKKDGELFLEKFFKVRSKSIDVQELYKKIRGMFGMSFVENPLHLSMAAEYFADRVKESSIDVLDFRPNILELFRCFVTKKFEIYCEDKGNVGNDLMKVRLMREMNAHHRIMALGALFENDHLRLLYENEREAILDENVRQQWLEMGIVRGFAGDEAVFVHRTFAEYFAAMRLAEMCIDEHRTGRLKDFLKAIRFYDDRHETLRNFFDWAAVKEESLAYHEAVLGRDERALKRHFADSNKRDKCGRTALHLAIMYGNYEMVKKFVEAGFEEQDASDRLFGWRPLTVAAFFANKETYVLAACRDDGKTADDLQALLDYVGDDVENRRRLLLFAARWDLVDLARVLLPGYELLAVDVYNKLLDYCVAGNNVNFARLLKLYGIKLNKERVLWKSINYEEYDVLKQTEKLFEVPTIDYKSLDYSSERDQYLENMQTFKKCIRNKIPLAEGYMELVHNDVDSFDRSFCKQIDDKTSLVCNIDHLLENDEQIIIIYGEKGRKTTVLGDIEKRATAMEIYFCQKAATCENSLLLLDDIDAFNESNVDAMLENRSRFRKVFATSRKRDEALEERIGAIAYTLEPLSRYAQKQLLRQEWSERLRPMNYTKTEVILSIFLYWCQRPFGTSLLTSPAPLLELAVYFNELFASKSRGEVESMLVEPHRYMNVHDAYGRMFAAFHSGDQVAMKAMKEAAIAKKFGDEFARRMFSDDVEGAASSSSSSRFFDEDACPFEGYLIATAVLEVLDRIDDAEMLKKIALHSMRRVWTFDSVFVSKLPLHYEVMMESVKDDKPLLDAATDADLKACDALGRTPLHLAVIYGKDNIWITDELIKRGADPAAEDHILRWRPLCYAIYLGHQDAFDELAKRESNKGVFEAAERVRRFVDNKKRLRIAFKATSFDVTAVVDAMIDDGEEALVSKPIDGDTLLHVAVMHGSARTAELLLTRKGADPFLRDSILGKSALERARARREGDEMRLLFERLYPLEKYPPPRHNQNNQGRGDTCSIC